MSERHRGAIGRRQLLRTGMMGFIATAAASALEVDTAVADTETDAEKRKARFQARFGGGSEFLSGEPLP